MIPVTDMQARALSRLAHQYRNSEKLKAVISLFVIEMEEVRDAAVQLEMLRRIDDSEGDALDVIGEIVGQPRVLAGIVDLKFFGYRDEIDPENPDHGFGDVNDPAVGGRYRSINEPESGARNLSDPEYRQMLRAKILRNKTRATPEDIIESIQEVLGDSPPVPVVISSGAGVVTATVQRVLDDEEEAILNAEVGIRGQIPVIPRPIGVSLTIGGL